MTINSMSDSQIEEIKNKLNILDVVSAYVKLTKTGINHRGLCPFHSEKGPSFFVSPSRQMFKCFGCGKGGDIFEFIKEIEGVEFGDALRILANRAGVELKRENPQIVSERKRFYEICDLSSAFFEKQLIGSEWGKKAKDYLLKRGITEESIKKWRIGYSPDMWQGLSDFLVGRGYNREEVVKAGLAVTSDLPAGRQEKESHSYDRFRGRIIFPIFDINSQVIGFTARIFKDADKAETAKYINTPQTLLYDKSNVLYGLNFAKVAVRKINQCVLTEGQTDTIMCQQAGFENTVAVSGTALTEKHLNILKRYTDNLLLSFDMDSAGDTATKRGIYLAESMGFNIRVIDFYDKAMPNGRQAKDPAEIILENPENWAKAIENTRSIMEFYFDSAFKKCDKNSSLGKKEIGKIILPAIKRLQNKIEQSHWVQKLAEKLQVSIESVLEELKNTKPDERPALTGHLDGPVTMPAERALVGEGKSGRKKLLESKIISLVLRIPNSLMLIGAEDYEIFEAINQKLLKEIKIITDAMGDNAEVLVKELSKKEEYEEILNEATLKEEVGCEEEGPDEVQICLNELKNIIMREKLENLSSLIKEESDLVKKDELIKQFQQIARNLHQKS